MSRKADRPLPADLARSAPVFAALGDQARLRLVALLCMGGAMSITQLTQGAAITRQGVTKHLVVLAQAGLVHDVRAGRERLWELNPSRLKDARHWLDTVASQWDQALLRLKAMVEA